RTGCHQTARQLLRRSSRRRRVIDPRQRPRRAHSRYARNPSQRLCGKREPIVKFNIRRRLIAGFFAVILLGSGVSATVLMLLTASILQLEDVITDSDTIRQRRMGFGSQMRTTM